MIAAIVLLVVNIQCAQSIIYCLNQIRYREGIFTMRMVKHWDTLPREVVDALSLETFKARLECSRL